MSEIILKEESYAVIGICMEVHRRLGMGFKEVLYKDALEIEFAQNNIPFKREVQYKVNYKGNILPHFFCADFVVYSNIVLEIKSASTITDAFLSQTINYLRASQLPLGIIANFGERSLNYKRVLV